MPLLTALHSLTVNACELVKKSEMLQNTDNRFEWYQNENLNLHSETKKNDLHKFSEMKAQIKV